ncbi:teichoic acid biosynthesis protein [Listeria booriae]|uniref:DUF6270 domain-containing protein n=1 Tax=Listeria booriae TaxID=1552123 RepID=UPI001626D9C4|nr:DUF6270 domain-containing protein [Listeria booriae]MBC1896988.1 teichoic acid biosynthesis protein [Listeria booriae]
MKILIKDIQLIDNKTWKIFGISERKITSIQAYSNDSREYVHPEQKLNIPFEQDTDTFTATISVADIAKYSMADQETDWKFKVNTDYPYTNLCTDGPITNKPFQPDSSLFRYQFEFPLGILTLISKPLEVSTHLENFSMDEQSVSGEISIKPSLTDKLFEARLLLKRRPTAQFYLFHEQQQVFNLGAVMNNRITFSIPLKDISSQFLVDDSNVLDAIIEIVPVDMEKGIPTYLSISSEVKPTVSQNRKVGAPLLAILHAYVTGSNRLSFLFKKNRQGIATLTQLSDTGEEFKFQLKPESDIKFSQSQIVAKRRDKKDKLFEYNIEQTWPIKKGLNKYSASISKKDFLAGPVNKADTTWDFYLRSEDLPDLPIMVPDMVDLSPLEYFDIANDQFKAKITKNGLRNLSCYTIKTPTNSENVTKIAILGTDFSYSAFNSRPFFNPDYEEFFECSIIQSHSSIISMMTEPATDIDLTNYPDIVEQRRPIIAEDLKKEFFANLEASNPDYFLIDLYPDVVRPVMWLNDKTAITLSYVVEQSQLLNDLSYEKIVDHVDNEAFFHEWTKYADQFISKLTEIIPPNRVILNSGGFTTSYYAKNRAILEYKGKMEIERNNYFWNRLNNYFMSKIPEATVIDFSKKPYIGDFNHPFGQSPSHFESTYYKDFLKELIYITQK